MAQIDIKQPTITKAKADSRNGVPRYEVADARAKGLRLRVGPGAIVWQYRFMMLKQSSTLTLGSIDVWSVDEARRLVSDAQVLIKGKVRRPDDLWVAEQLVAHGKVEAPTPEIAIVAGAATWTWETARDNWLVYVEGAKRNATFIDYRNRIRNVPELQRFAGRLVSTITRKEAARLLTDIADRNQSQAEHVRDVLKSFWTWLSLDANSDDSGVEFNTMVGLVAPERKKQGEIRQKAYTPPMHEVGRIMAIAKSGAIDERISLAILFLVYTCQRVTPIVRARRDGMSFAEDRSQGLWSMTAHHRKTADKRGDSSDHVVPLPPQAWAVVQRAMELTEQEDLPRVFPGFRPQKAGDPTPETISQSAVQHNISYMPGVLATPHDLRRSFAELATEQFEWDILDSKVILDHNEGIGSNDVTARSYLFKGTHKKWRIIRSWCDWVDEHTAAAVEFDSRLTDVAWLKSQIEYNRCRKKKRKGQKLPPVDLTKRRAA